MVTPDRVLSMGQIELNCFVWDGTVLTFKLCTYAMLNWIVWNETVFCMLNWIVWNRTVYMYKNGFGIK